MNFIKIKECEFLPVMYVPNPLAYCSYQAFSALADLQEEIVQLKLEIERLKEYEFMYKDLNK